MLIGCQPKEKKKEEKISADISIAEKTFMFGTAKQEDTIKHTFKIKNIGSVPLIIKSVKASCGCTTSKWSTKPISANKEASIDVVFVPNAGSKGVIKKSIVVQANTDSAFHVFYLSGTIVE